MKNKDKYYMRIKELERANKILRKIVGRMEWDLKEAAYLLDQFNTSSICRVTPRDTVLNAYSKWRKEQGF